MSKFIVYYSKTVFCKAEVDAPTKGDAIEIVKENFNDFEETADNFDKIDKVVEVN